MRIPRRHSRPEYKRSPPPGCRGRPNCEWNGKVPDFPLWVPGSMGSKLCRAKGPACKARARASFTGFRTPDLHDTIVTLDSPYNCQLSFPVPMVPFLLALGGGTTIFSSYISFVRNAVSLVILSSETRQQGFEHGRRKHTCSHKNSPWHQQMHGTRKARRVTGLLPRTFLQKCPQRDGGEI